MKNTVAIEVREHLVEVGGRMTQDIGLGRIVGQVLVYIYLSEGEKSLDEIGDNLGLSKAAVSIAARQLENLALVQRVWKKGDKRKYYKTVNDLGSALQHGVLGVVRNKLRLVNGELEQAECMLGVELGGKASDSDVRLIQKRLTLTRKWSGRLDKLVNSPMLHLLKKIS